MDAPLVLLVDDDVELLEFMKGAVESLGVRTSTATAGREALELIDQLKPAAIVLDLVLPQISGAQVMATLRARGDEMPIILTSGVATAPTIGDGVEFLPKPFSEETLRHAVKRALLRAR